MQDIERLNVLGRLTAFCLALCFASSAHGVTNNYEVDLSPAAFTDILRSGTPPISPGGSPDFAGLYLSNAFFYRSDLASEYDLSVVPAGAQVRGDATTEFYVTVSSSGPSNTPVRYYASRGNGSADIFDVLDRSALVGQLEDTGQGTNRTVLDTAFLQELLDERAPYLALGATYTNPSSGWVKIERNFGSTIESAALSFKYEVEVPNATQYHAAPIYDGSITSLDAGATHQLDLDERTISVLDGFSTVPNRLSRGLAEFDLSTVPADSVVQSATLTVQFFGRPLIDSGATPKGVVINGFAGDGTPTIDALQSIGNTIGQSGGFSSRRAYPISLNPFYVEQLIRGGENLGVLLSQQATGVNYNFAALESNTTNRFELDLVFAPSPTAKRTMAFEPVVDSGVEIDGAPTLAGRSALINVSGGSVSGVVERGVVEFDHSAFPSARTSLSRASLEIQILDRLDDTAKPLPLSVYGYVGDGVASPTDALELSTLLGTAQIGNEGLVQIELDTHEVERLMAGSSYVGLVLVSDDADLGLRVWSVETGLTAPPPKLALEFSVVPEPSTLGIFVLLSVALVAQQRRLRSA